MKENFEAIAERAARLAGNGMADEAEALYRRLLEQQPDNLAALQFLGWQALRAGRVADSVAMLKRACDADARQPALYVTLGQAQLQSGDWAAANDSFDHALALKPGLAPALLCKGLALERLDRAREAAQAFHGALYHAQRTGEWADFDRLAADLRTMIDHAARCVRERRRELLYDAIAPLADRHGRAALARIEACIAVYLHDTAPDYPDPRQHPTFLFIPGLSTEPFYHDHAPFPWLAELEAASADIRAEWLNAHRESQGFQSVVEVPGGLPVTDEWRPLNHTMQWNALYFYRYGRRFDENCRRCPKTAALMDHLPLIRLAEHSPEAHFSVLEPGAHIPLHTGVTNARLVVHLPLIIPPDCGIRIAGETHEWTEGRCLVFDDTFEHEAWNGSDRTRSILILDTWNPRLTPPEREAVAVLVQTIGQTPVLQN